MVSGGGSVTLWKKIIDPRHVFIIAEAGVNHNGDIHRAKHLIDVAREAGCDAVKFQTFKAEKLVTPHAPKASYQLKTTSAAESHFEMLRCLELSFEHHKKLYDYCLKKGILFMSTPFDEDSADFLDTLGVPVFKIPSGELTNSLFLAHIARKGKPLILSTGMSHLQEVQDAVEIFKKTKNKNFALLHCVSQYPTDPQDVNLKAMDTLAHIFHVPVGFSDHTLGIEISLAAVARGAQIIEKHFTLDRNLKGPDHKASLEPLELKALVRGIRNIEVALGHGRKEPASGENEVAKVSRKSLVAAQDIPMGTSLSEEHLAAKRPGTGLSPAMKPYVLGKKVKVFIRRNQLIHLDMLA